MLTEAFNLLVQAMTQRPASEAERAAMEPVFRSASRLYQEGIMEVLYIEHNGGSEDLCHTKVVDFDNTMTSLSLLTEAVVRGTVTDLFSEGYKTFNAAADKFTRKDEEEKSLIPGEFSRDFVRSRFENYLDMLLAKHGWRATTDYMLWNDGKLMACMRWLEEGAKDPANTFFAKDVERVTIPVKELAEALKEAGLQVRNVPIIEKWTPQQRKEAFDWALYIKGEWAGHHPVSMPNFLEEASQP